MSLIAVQLAPRFFHIGRRYGADLLPFVRWFFRRWRDDVNLPGSDLLANAFDLFGMLFPVMRHRVLPESLAVPFLVTTACDFISAGAFDVVARIPNGLLPHVREFIFEIGVLVAGRGADKSPRPLLIGRPVLLLQFTGAGK